MMGTWCYVVVQIFEGNWEIDSRTMEVIDGGAELWWAGKMMEQVCVCVCVCVCVRARARMFMFIVRK